MKRYTGVRVILESDYMDIEIQDSTINKAIDKGIDVTDDGALLKYYIETHKNKVLSSLSINDYEYEDVKEDKEFIYGYEED